MPNETEQAPAELWARYPGASHKRAIVSARSLPQTSKTMETKPGMWNGVGKSEKLSIVLLAFCILSLVTILFLRLF